MGNLLNCPTFPAGRSEQIIARYFLDEYAPGEDCGPPACANIPGGLPSCASNIYELYCLLEEVKEHGSNKCNSVTVCEGATINFGKLEWLDDVSDLGGTCDDRRQLSLESFLRTSFELDVPDKTKILCETCGTCKLKRPYLSILYSLCPFFTTQLGNEIQVTGFKFKSDYFPSEANIIAFNNYNGMSLAYPQNRDIKVKSDYTTKSCGSSKSKSKSKSKDGKGGCKSKRSGSGKDSPSGRGRRIGEIIGVKQQGEPFCGPSDFFDDDEDDEGSLVFQKNSAAEPSARNGGTNECNPETNPLVAMFLAADSDSDGIVSCAELNAAQLATVGMTCEDFVPAAVKYSSCFASVAQAQKVNIGEPSDAETAGPGLTLAPN